MGSCVCHQGTHRNCQQLGSKGRCSLGKHGTFLEGPEEIALSFPGRLSESMKTGSLNCRTGDGRNQPGRFLDGGW